MHRKNPFGPEPQTTPSVRNPVLERAVRRSSLAPAGELVSEVPRPSQTRRAYRPSAAPTLPPPPAVGDDTTPATPRPRVSDGAVPRVVAGGASIRQLPLGAREGFLLAHLDGATDLRTLVDVTGMSELEVTLIVEKLIGLGVVEV